MFFTTFSLPLPYSSLSLSLIPLTPSPSFLSLPLIHSHLFFLMYGYIVLALALSYVFSLSERLSRSTSHLIPSDSLFSHSFLLIPIFSFLSSHFLRVITDGADGEVKARESWREEQYKKRQEEVEASKVTTLHCVWILFSVSGFYSVCLDSFQCVWILFTVSGFRVSICPILGVVHLSGRIHSH